MISKSFAAGPKEPVSHNNRIQKNVLIKYGNCANLTQLARAVFPPGESVEPHCHQTMAEVFLVRSGQGRIIVNGQKASLIEDACIIVEPGEMHELTNTGTVELVIDYFGLEVQTADDRSGPK